jgi:hypothetical protein
MRISIVVVIEKQICPMTRLEKTQNGYLDCALHVPGQHFFFAMVLLQSQRLFLFF